MRLIRWSVDNPHAIIALYLALVALAVVAVWRFIPTRMMPYIESPIIGIITRAPGMDAEEVETYVSKPIETRMVDVGGVRFIRSTSTQDVSIVSLEFNYRYDMRRALADVQNLVATVRTSLPATGVEAPWVLPVDPLNVPVLKLALTAPRWDPVRLRELADNELVNRLKQVPGVESVYAMGGLKRQAQIVLERDKLAAYGLSVDDVREALDAANVDMAAGRLTWKGTETVVRLADRAHQAADMAHLVVGSVAGQPVYLSDVGRVLDTFAERRSLYRFNGQEAIELNIVQRPSASSPRTLAGVHEELQRIQRDYPDLVFQEAYDNAHFVEIVRANMLKELATGVALTGLVVFLFLGDLRGTCIALTTIPTSLAVAVLGFLPFGLSLNSSTLIGLLLAIGRLVDDAVIDLHSIDRHRRMGKSARDAAIDGCTEVRKSVIAATVMIGIAMLPMTFTGGLTQAMFEGIVWPFLFCLAASLLVALTLTPLLAAHVYASGPSRFSAPWMSVLDGTDRGYQRVLRWALQHRGLVLAGAAVAVYVAITLFPLIGYEMMPLADVGQAYAVLEARPGTSLAETARMTAQLERILRAQPEITKVSTEVGFELGGTWFTGYSMGNVSTANLLLTFTDKERRSRSIWDVIDAVYAQAMRTIPNIRRLSIKEMGSDVMASSQAPIELLIYGPDLQRLDWLANQTRAIMERHYPDIVQPATAWSLTMPEYRLNVDAVLAAHLGLTAKDVAEQASAALGGISGEQPFSPPNVRPDTFLIRYDADQRQDRADLENVFIVGRGGQRVPLQSVATVSRHLGAAVIYHDGLRRVNSVLGYYRKGGPGSMNLTMGVMMDSLFTLPYPPGYGMEQRGDMTQMMDSFYRLLVGLGTALVAMYLVLTVQFRSLLQPLALMAAIPLELVGVFGALLLAHQTFSTVSILGLVVLNGMDVTASILLIDLIMVKRAQGLGAREAVEAACPIRLRPILMTVGVTLAVMLPVAIAAPTGLDAYAPLATVVLGGLSVSTVLTLVVVPVLYTLLDDQARKTPRWASRGSLPPGGQHR